MQANKVLHCFIMVLLLLGLVLGTHPSLAAPQQQEAIWNVTYPSDGTVVNGEVSIQGTASHPNFDSYGLLYATGPQPTGSSEWIPIAFGVKTMVVNGPLGVWDTTALSNGQYTLALAVYEVGNTNPNLFFINNITIQNEEATPTPTEEPLEPTPEPVEGSETTPAEGDAPLVPPAGPTIELPPTATPRPTPTLVPGETPQAGADSADDSALTALFPASSLKETFCTGVRFAVLLYIIGGLYTAAKVAWRYYKRYQSQQQQRGNQP